MIKIVTHLKVCVCVHTCAGVYVEMGMMRYEYKQWRELYYKHYCKSLIPYLGNLELYDNGIE